MKTLILLVLLLLASKPACAFDDWTKTNTALQVVYTALHVIDWGQAHEKANISWVSTRKIESGIEVTTVSETNPILGKAPSVSDVNIYFASTLIAHTIISYALPKGWRTAWQGATIGLELAVVGRNYSIGMNGFF